MLTRIEAQHLLSGGEITQVIKGKLELIIEDYYAGDKVLIPRTKQIGIVKGLVSPYNPSLYYIETEDGTEQIRRDHMEHTSL